MPRLRRDPKGFAEGGSTWVLAGPFDDLHQASDLVIEMKIAWVAQNGTLMVHESTFTTPLAVFLVNHGFAGLIRIPFPGHCKECILSPICKSNPLYFAGETAETPDFLCHSKCPFSKRCWDWTLSLRSGLPCPSLRPTRGSLGNWWFAEGLVQH